MVCSCARSSNFVWLQIETTLFSFLRSVLLKMTDRFASRRYSFLKDSKTIIELDYHKNIVILQCLADQLLVYLISTDKSLYFAQPRPIIDNYWLVTKRPHSSRAWFEGEVKVKFVYLFVDNHWGQRGKRFKLTCT